METAYTHMLKLSGSQFHMNLLVLFNKILSTKIWPFTDNNIVVFLRKPGRKDYSDTANYRPITLSSVVGKLFERIIESRLREIVEENNWLDKDQHGFRRGKSTGTYLSQMISTIQHTAPKTLQLQAFLWTYKKHSIAFGTTDYYTDYPN